uniref:Uncharacterized protein n=1 Tax=viral metagenome TaxID=1070528 RepID=A0A6C0JE14_9ZZZZ
MPKDRYISKAQEIAELNRKLQRTSHELKMCNDVSTSTKSTIDQVRNLVSEIHTIRNENAKKSFKQNNV